jgi:hypothetical protein
MDEKLCTDGWLIQFKGKQVEKKFARLLVDDMNAQFASHG